jgi:DNA repair protein SbcC/Rad50
MLAINLPSGIQQRLSKEFAEMEKRARDAVAGIRERRQQAGWIALLDKITACAAQSTASPSADSANAAALNALWEQAQELPKGINTGLLETFRQEGSADGIDEQLREACIALEVQAGIESPPEDKKARMNYQMQRLVKGMGSKAIEPEPDLLGGINAFIALRPSHKWAERYCSTVRHIKGIRTT